MKSPLVDLGMFFVKKRKFNLGFFIQQAHWCFSDMDFRNQHMKNILNMFAGHFLRIFQIFSSICESRHPRYKTRALEQKMKSQNCKPGLQWYVSRGMVKRLASVQSRGEAQLTVSQARVSFSGFLIFYIEFEICRLYPISLQFFRENMTNSFSFSVRSKIFLFMKIY